MVRKGIIRNEENGKSGRNGEIGGYYGGFGIKVENESWIWKVWKMKEVVGACNKSVCFGFLRLAY